MSVLNKIMGVIEASEKWGFSPDHVKKMCRDGDVEATKIGKTWILEKEQNPPKRKRISVDIVTDIGYNVIRRSDKALLKIRRNYR